MTQAQVVSFILSENLSNEQVRQIVSALEFKNYIVSTVVPETKQSETFGQFLERFWDWDRSPYVKEKRIVGQSIHRRYTDIMKSRARTYLIPHLGQKPLESITKNDIKQILWKLATQKQKVYSRKKKSGRNACLCPERTFERNRKSGCTFCNMCA